jgi:hypothetical protein
VSSLLDEVTGALLDALSPLADALASADGIERLLGCHGWRAGVDPGNVSAIGTTLGLSLLAQASALASEIDSSAADPLALVQQLATAVPGVVEDLQSLAGGSAALSFAPFSTPGFWAQFIPDLLNGLIADWLERRQPLLHAAATLLGLIERIQVSVPAQAAGRLPYQQTVINWDQLGTAAANPGRQVASTYHWGDPATPFDHDRLLRALERVLVAAGVPARREPVGPQLASYYAGGQVPAGLRQLAVPLLAGVPLDLSGYLNIGVIIAPVPPAANRAAAPDGLLGYPVAQGYDTYAVSLGGPFSLELSGGFDADGAVTAEVHPGSAAVATHLPAPLAAGASLTAIPSAPWVPLGTPDGIHVEMPGLLASVQVQGAITSPEVILTVGTGPGPNPPKVALILQFTDGDSFLRSIFGTAAQRVEFGLGITWSSKTGLSLQTSAGLKLVFPVNRTLAAVSVQNITALLRASGTGAELRLGVSATAAIGPVQVTADGVGAQLELAPRAVGAPVQAFGDLGLSFGFAGPSGLGLAVDAGPVSGGGFLSSDPASGRYAGALELRMESLALKAIGLLDTRMPDGSDGYSLIVIITAEFEAIQLGFGFTLTGVGGLAGINRTVVIDALRAGVRAHRLNNILFPPDPVRNAGQILSDMATIFPPAPGQYVFGPMLQLGWGTPTVLTLELGLLLELPPPLRLIVLGRIALMLPDPDAPLVRIQMDSLGVVDFGAGQVAIDAVLFDSNIAGFALTGAMALRAGWLGQPGFTLAIGGFSPYFSPPAQFPALDRVTIALTSGNNPRLRLSAYLALTSNTAQIGARLDLYAQGPFGITLEGSLCFDALFQFSPFQFVVGIGGSVTIKSNGQPLLSASVQVTLSGPNGWHVQGQASFQLFCLSISVSFDTTIGSAQPLPAPPPVQLAPLLEAALAEPANWAAALPADASTLLTFSAAATAGTVPAHPLAALAVHQRVLPLDIAIQRYGTATPADPGSFTISSVTIGTTAASALSPVDDWFAPGQFLRLSDAESLQRPSFEQLHAGVTVTTPPFVHDTLPPPAVPAGYLTMVYDTLGGPAREVVLPGPASMPASAALAGSPSGTPAAAAAGAAAAAVQIAAAGGTAASRGRARFLAAGLPLRMIGPQYALATTATLAAAGAAQSPGAPSSWTATAQNLATYLAANPGQAGQVQVVAGYEVH